MTETDNSVLEEIVDLFDLARRIDFEAGMLNDFWTGIETVIDLHGVPAIRHIKEFVLGEQTTMDIASTALVYVGDLESGNYKNERRIMLEDCLLNSPYSWVRDGAVSGLSAMSDPASIPAIEKAIEKETSNTLRPDMQRVLDRLKDNQGES